MLLLVGTRISWSDFHIQGRYEYEMTRMWSLVVTRIGLLRFVLTFPFDSLCMVQKTCAPPVKVWALLVFWLLVHALAENLFRVAACFAQAFEAVGGSRCDSCLWNVAHFAFCKELVMICCGFSKARICGYADVIEYRWKLGAPHCFPYVCIECDDLWWGYPGAQQLQCYLRACAIYWGSFDC